MAKQNGKHQLSPPHEISQGYTIAMWSAQLLEDNLRAILHIAHYHGWGHPIELDETQSKRFKEDEKRFIDDATFGSLFQKLKQIKIVNPESALNALECAPRLRNELAHSFLSKVDFDRLTKEREAEVVERLVQMAVTLGEALSVSKTIREQLEQLAQEDREKMEKLFGEF